MVDFIRDDNGDYHIANGNTDFIRDPNGDFHLPQQAIDGGITNDGTEKLDVYNITSDGGNFTTDGKGNTKIIGNLTTSGINTLNGVVNITNTSGMITANSAGTTENWYMRRSASTVTSNKYTLLSSYNGTSKNAITFYDTGTITTTLGTVANLGTTNNFTQTITAPTPSITDNSTNVATTAYVNNLVSSLQKVVNGDISTTGNSISITIPNENVLVSFVGTGTNTAKIIYQATTGTISPVDIRRVTVWGGSGVETYTLDGGTLTTTPTVADDTIYTQSNDTSIHFIRINGNIYIVTVWASGGGKRASLMYRQLI